MHASKRNPSGVEGEAIMPRPRSVEIQCNTVERVAAKVGNRAAHQLRSCPGALYTTGEWHLPPDVHINSAADQRARIDLRSTSEVERYLNTIESENRLVRAKSTAATVAILMPVVVELVQCTRAPAKWYSTSRPTLCTRS